MKRGAGILLPVFSLPTKYGIGTFGKEAYDFVDFLEETKQSYWQLLPTNPTGYGDSPYQSFSAFALNPYFIDLEKLILEGLLTAEDCKKLDHPYRRGIDYKELYDEKFTILKVAYKNGYEARKEEVEKFVKTSSWVKDYSLFMVIKNHFGGGCWLEWPEEYRLRDRKTLLKFKKENLEEIEFYTFIQYLAFKQYGELRKYAHSKNINIIGDIPIYVAIDSADVWANPTQFQLDSERRPTKVAGVPPDYFSATGQLWGNPLYDYEAMAKDGFKWWTRRVKACGKLFDVLRIDHFRGFEAYWSIKYGEETAINGEWVKGPGKALIDVINKAAGKMQIIAEDLGFLTQEVIDLKEYSTWPGLAIYQFAFDSRNPRDPYLPENYKENVVAYIGTHDNDTLLHLLQERQDLIPHIEYCLNAKGIDEIYDKMISRLHRSRANTVILTMQDYLKEGGEYRINTPGTPSGNWQYRLSENYKTQELVDKITRLTIESNRHGN